MIIFDALVRVLLGVGVLLGALVFVGACVAYYYDRS